jgi:3-ketosteroid 9alpha-monooxygenase subunit B
VPARTAERGAGAHSGDVGDVGEDGAGTGTAFAAPPRYLLPVAEVVEETADARTVVFRVPDELRERFGYRPGQFLTLRVPGAGGGGGGGAGDAARCYSLCSNPYTDGSRLRVTVKRVAGGLGSNWVCDSVRAGDEIQVLPPAGTFSPSAAALDSDLLLVAGGSGITPLMSILDAALTEGQGTVALLYANRDQDSVIFAERLRELSAAHPGRLVVLHWLESVQGLPDRERLAALCRPYAGREAFLCGPQPLMDAVADALGALGARRERIHRERFFSLSGDVWGEGPAPLPDAGDAADAVDAVDAADGADASAARAVVELDGETRELAWPAGTLLLDAMLRAGLDAPYSCREGACAACTCRVVEGEVALDRNEVLDVRDLADGYVLACQARARSERVAVTYEG